MSDVVENPTVQPAAAVDMARIARQQRYLILSLMIFSLVLGIGIGAILTRGAFADPDSRIALNTQPLSPDALSSSFAQASTIVEPAVVYIETKEDDTDGEGAREGRGSGVLVTAEGYVLTNFHVIQGAKSIRIRLADRRQYDGKVVGRDPETDLAVVKIQGNGPFPFAHFGDSDHLRVGEWVLAIGSPFGLEQTVTAGIISAKERETEGGSSAFQKFLQTDAAINPGNSGGPLVNLAGEVVGINTQIATRTGAFSGIGFALPSSTAVEIYNELVKNGHVGRGFLGIQVGPVSPEVAQSNGLEGTDGALVDRLSTQDGPAAKAGLVKGDVITEINGEPVRDGRDLIRRVGAMPSGTVVRLTYIREGRPGSATVKLTDRDEGLKASTQALPDGLDPRDFDEEEPGAAPTPNDPIRLGLSLRTLTPELARDRNLGELTGALVLAVEASSRSAGKVLAGDVVLMVNGHRIASEPEFVEQIAGLRAGTEITLQIARRVGTRIERRAVTMTMP